MPVPIKTGFFSRGYINGEKNPVKGYGCGTGFEPETTCGYSRSGRYTEKYCQSSD